MKIFKRIVTILKSNINYLISKAEDPKKMLTQLVIDMQEVYVEAKSEVANVIADEKQLEKAYLHEKEKIIKWEKKVIVAVKANNDELAREALARQVEHENIANQYKEQWVKQKKSSDKLKFALSQLRNKIEEAKRKKNLLIARVKRAEAQGKINKVMLNLQDNCIFDTFGRMEEKVESIEAKNEAMSELDVDFLEDSLEKKFEALEKKEGNVDIEDRLAELKIKIKTAT